LTSGGEDQGVLALRECRDEVSDLFAVHAGAYRFPIAPIDCYPQNLFLVIDGQLDGNCR
jgi:hypothetical protein